METSNKGRIKCWREEGMALHYITLHYIKDNINKTNGEKEKMNCMYKVFVYIFKRCTMHYRSYCTQVFCAKAVIKTL